MTLISTRPSSGVNDREASLASKAEFEYLYDKPCDDKKKVRVAGPFTVENPSPYRVLGLRVYSRPFVVNPFYPWFRGLDPPLAIGFKLWLDPG